VDIAHLAAMASRVISARRFCVIHVHSSPIGPAPLISSGRAMNWAWLGLADE
jgi:hypothetical protein